MALAYTYLFEVDGRDYFVYAESQFAAEEQIRLDQGDDVNIKFVERTPF